MKLLGFNFTKINIEKYKDSFKDLKLENHVDVTSVAEIKKETIKSDDDFLAVKFKYIINYKPEVAKLEMEGTILVSVEPKIAKETLKRWKVKETPDEFRIPLFNIIFKKTRLKTLEP